MASQTKVLVREATHADFHSNLPRILRAGAISRVTCRVSFLDLFWTYSPEKWLHNWIATGPNKSKKLTRLTSPAHTTHGKVRINLLEIWVAMQRASKQRSSRCDHANRWACGAIQWIDATMCAVCLSLVTSLHSNYLYHGWLIHLLSDMPLVTLSVKPCMLFFIQTLPRILCVGDISRVSFLDLFGPIAGATNPIMT